MEDKKDLLRKLPKIDRLIESDMARRHARVLGRAAVLDICRKAVESAKRRAIEAQAEPRLDALIADVDAECEAEGRMALGRVVNGTGVLLHTNLGRAPLGAELFAEMAAIAGGYCNLEIDVAKRKRGVRGHHVSRLLAQACEAEDAIVVNNNAAALFLTLREFAPGREVIVSRGELVQIGGGFRIPDILAASGALLREVGTTNITTLEDYRAAIGEKTALLLKVHQANFRMEGFVKTPGVRDLAKEDRGGALLVSDLGSGNLARTLHGRPIGEPTPAEMLKDGADLVCFSCDKMLGGVQGGVIAGRADLVARLRQNPVMRVVRVDKTVYAALQVVLSRHLAGEHETLLLWSLAAADADAVRARADRFLKQHGLGGERFCVVDAESTFGGGSTPGQTIPSAAVRVAAPRSADEVARFLQELSPPVVGTVKEGAFQIDFRTVLPEDEPILAAAFEKLVSWL